jgi:hypothetical protein
MTELAAQLVERVLPEVPARQWVLSLPWSLRYLLAFDAALCRDVLAVFIRVVFGWLRRRAMRHGVRNGQCGAVTVIQRFGGALNANVHFHSLVLDGVFTRPTATAAPVFQALPRRRTPRSPRCSSGSTRAGGGSCADAGAGPRSPAKPIRRWVTLTRTRSSSRCATTRRSGASPPSWPAFRSAPTVD